MEQGLMLNMMSFIYAAVRRISSPAGSNTHMLKSVLESVAMPARQFAHAMQILNHYSFL
jgi:hypothetical protein